MPASSSDRTPVLVITDALPHPESNDADLRLSQILQTLHELGHPVTLIARDDRWMERAQRWIALGMRVYAGDYERLWALGRDCGSSTWTLEKILAETEYNLALLVQNFRCGITVPEHYLDEIRKRSPRTWIAIVSDEGHGKSALARAQMTQKLEHFEVAEDRRAREQGAYSRADLVILASDLAAYAGGQACPERSRRECPPYTVSLTCKTRSPKNGWAERKGILLAVNFTRPGDVDGFIWFLQQIWTIVSRKSREIELLVVGGEQVPQESRQKLTQVKWIHTSELEATIETARLFVSPVRFGVTSSSLFVMAASGVPGVATRFATEFSGFREDDGVIPTDTAEQFADRIVRLHNDEKLWQEQSGKAQAFITQRHSPETQRAEIEGILEQLPQIPLRTADTASFSMTILDSLLGESLRNIPTQGRIARRLDGHAHLAEQFLRDGNPSAAIQQVRHVFSWLGDSIQATAPVARLLALLARCYRELGQPAMIARCAKKARRCFTVQSPDVKNAPAVHKNKNAPKISLIVPTYNRLSILKKCLAALEAQTISRDLFEVIVIDDGSSDGTEEAMRQYQPPFGWKYLRQSNGGTGSARKNGVNHATGEHLLLMNDDTICDPDLIEQHLRMQKHVGNERWAVLGNFEYPDEARRRAFTHFLRVGSFMFPQVEMEDGFPYPYSHFITCNLSIKRAAVMQAGSFDATYKLCEDTELGIRLYEMGYGVMYHRAAHAWHDHLPYAVENLKRRAKVYGADYFYMFRRHPRVIQEWAMPIPLAGMNQETALRIREYLDRNRHDVEAAAEALNNWDNIEFEPILKDKAQTTHVMSLFRQAVPAIHWLYLFESMLETMVRELEMPKMHAAAAR